jgi:hypothetical protein
MGNDARIDLGKRKSQTQNATGRPRDLTRCQRIDAVTSGVKWVKVNMLPRGSLTRLGLSQIFYFNAEDGSCGLLERSIYSPQLGSPV